MGAEYQLITCYIYVYAIWALIVSVIDAVVCGDIFYISSYYDTYRNETRSYIQQLYSLEDMDPGLSHWLQVYGATSVTKLAAYFLIIINPPLILIIGSYLYVIGNNLDTRLSTSCKGNISSDNYVSNITCQVFNNQYQQLELFNQIQLFGSIIVVGIIPLPLMIIFGSACVIIIFKYLSDIIIRVDKILCCGCYRRFCKKFAYIFCYGPEPEPFKSNNII
jgi:hypothetical protein